MLKLGEFVEAANSVVSAEDLAALLVRDMRNEGYDNVSFRRVNAGELLLIQCVSLPPSFIEEYFANEFMADDPLVATALESRKKFYWSDLEKSQTLSPRQHEVLQAFSDLGTRAGISFPFHGPDGSCDLIGISQRHVEPVDPGRLGVIEDKLKFTRWRYWELRQRSTEAGSEPSQHNSWLAHLHGPPDMMAGHCRALVFVSVAAQRWQRGFTRFNRRLLKYVSPGDLEWLLRWGLIQEVPDERHFYFYFAPTELGRHHLRTCAHVPEFRRQVWEMEVGARRGVAS